MKDKIMEKEKWLVFEYFTMPMEGSDSGGLDALIDICYSLKEVKNVFKQLKYDKGYTTFEAYNTNTDMLYFFEPNDKGNIVIIHKRKWVKENNI